MFSTFFQDLLNFYFTLFQILFTYHIVVNHLSPCFVQGTVKIYAHWLNKLNLTLTTSVWLQFSWSCKIWFRFMFLAYNVQTCACQHFRRYVIRSSDKWVGEISLVLKSPLHKRLQYIIVTIVTTLVFGCHVILGPSSIRFHRVLTLVTS